MRGERGLKKKKKNFISRTLCLRARTMCLRTSALRACEDVAARSFGTYMIYFATVVLLFLLNFMVEAGQVPPENVVVSTVFKLEYYLIYYLIDFFSLGE